MIEGMGINGFVWFEGVVEARNDPLLIGRCRVRCFQFDAWGPATDVEGTTLYPHPDMPTSTLPWAYPLLPLNSAQGSVRAPKEGTWVFGFFRDGDAAQDRVIVGTINTGYNKFLEDSEDPAEEGAAGPAAIIPANFPGITSPDTTMRDVADVAGDELTKTGQMGIGEIRDGTAEAFGATTVTQESLRHLKTPDPVEEVKANQQVNEIIAVRDKMKNDMSPEEIAEADPGIKNFLSSSNEVISDVVKTGKEIAGLGDVSGVTSALATMEGSSGLGKADASLDVAMAGLDMADQAVDVLGEIDVEDLDLSNIADSLSNLHPGVKKVVDFVEKIPGGIEGLGEKMEEGFDKLGDEIEDIDWGGLKDEGIRMGVQMALAQPEVQMALAKMAQVVGMVQKIMKMQQMAQKILSKLSSVA